MIVLDASAVVDLVLELSPRADWVAERLERVGAAIFAPHLLDVEALSALRRRVASGELSVSRADAALALLRRLPVERYPHTALLEPMWRLRGRLTAYDAAYVALAEVLDATLLTTDARLGRAGLGARVEAYPG